MFTAIAVKLLYRHTCLRDTVTGSWLVICARINCRHWYACQSSMMHMHSTYIYVQRACLFITHAAYVHLHLSIYSRLHTCWLHVTHTHATHTAYIRTHTRSTCSWYYARRFWPPPAPRLPMPALLRAAIIVSNDSDQISAYVTMCYIFSCICHIHMCVPSALPCFILPLVVLIPFPAA